MVRQVLLAAVTIILVEAMPVSASAQLCDGILSWLCFNAEPASKRVSEQPPQRAVTAIPRYPMDKSKKGTGSARSRDLRETAAADTSADFPANCLSQEQVRGGYPRYRVIGGRHCWYASVRGRQPKPAEINVNPYDDPIWKGSDTAGPELAATQVKDCEEQSLKLDSEEKRTFMKQCMSNNMR